MLATKAKAKVIKPKLPRHSLICYHGGGYSGCIWEWNHAYIDGKGEFHCITATGCMGCKTREALNDKFQKFMDEMAAHRAYQRSHGKGKYARKPNDMDIYDVRDKKRMLKASDEIPVDHMVGVAAWFDRYTNLPPLFFPKCDACGKRFNVLEGQAEHLRGVGGLAMAHRDIICPICLKEGSCDRCQEYVGSEHIVKESDGTCEWCWKDVQEEDAAEAAKEQQRIDEGTAIPEPKRIEPLPGQMELFPAKPKKRGKRG